MNTLTDLYNQAIVPMDVELEKQATELVKQAEEEDAAGRIMARGFADEMNKLAAPPAPPVAAKAWKAPGQQPAGTGATAAPPPKLNLAQLNAQSKTKV